MRYSAFIIQTLIVLTLVVPNSALGDDQDKGRFQAVLNLHRVRAREIGRKVGVNFKTLETEHFFIFYSDLLGSVKSMLAKHCENVHKSLSEIFKLEEGTSPWEGKCVIYMLLSEQNFRKIAADFDEETPSTTAYYRWVNRFVYITMRYHERGAYNSYRDIRHECAHLFLAQHKKPGELKPWIQEGFAQWFEFQTVLKKRKIRYSPETRLLKKRHEMVKRSVILNTFQPIEEMFTLKDIAASDKEGYAMSLSLVDCLVSNGGVDKFLRFVAHLKDGKSEGEALKITYSWTIAEFEGVWKRFVLDNYPR